MANSYCQRSDMKKYKWSNLSFATWETLRQHNLVEDHLSLKLQPFFKAMSGSILKLLTLAIYGHCINIEKLHEACIFSANPKSTILLTPNSVHVHVEL